MHQAELLLLADRGVEGKGGAADEEERSRNDAGLVGDLTDARLSNHDGGFRFDVERSVSHHATGGSNDDPDDEQQYSHFPLNTGLRFSRNALAPSSLSSVEKHSAKRSTSRRSPSSRFERDASFTASFASCKAIGPLSAIRFAISSVFARNCSLGNTWLTNPILNAVFASMISPVRIISIALPSPTRRVRRWVPPPPGIMPRLISGWPSEADSLATRMSHANASSQPPPRQ